MTKKLNKIEVILNDIADIKTTLNVDEKSIYLLGVKKKDIESIFDKELSSFPKKIFIMSKL